MISRKIWYFFVVSIVFGVVGTGFAEDLVLCMNKTSGKILVKESCSRKESRLSRDAISKFTQYFDPTKCYWRLGTSTSLEGEARQVTIQTMCDSNDVAVSHALEHNETNRIVAISSIALETIVGATHTLPQGVTYRLNISTSIPSGAGSSAELGVLCCEYSN